MSEAWPPNYVDLFAWRQKQLLAFRSNPTLLQGALEYYRKHPVEFICDWVDTYDPRNAGVEGKITRMPFIMFERQKELAQFIYACLEGEADGLAEKCRDAGATWTCVAASVHLWRFWEGMAIGWGSRKEKLVDEIGVMDSIFEKIRAVIRGLPYEFLPPGMDFKEHMRYMRIINPHNGSTIVGEAGDNIGRGGRTRIYFKDEAQPLDEPVLTPDGWRAIGDLRVGDLVTSPNGEPVRVTGVNDCGSHPVYKVQLIDGSWTRASENHRWILASGKEVRTSDILTGYRRTYGTQVQYPMRLPGYVRTPECPFWLPRKAEAWTRKQTCDRAVRRVDPLGPMPVRCITVEGGLYVTRDYIVTHNSAHYERPELIEAALGDNTRVQIDISSVNGIGNVFHRKREAGVEWEAGGPVVKGKTNVFVFDWSDHPEKTEEWYKTRRAKYEDEGMLHLFAQEVDRDYAASVEGVIIKAEWVRAAVDAHIKLQFSDDGGWCAGLDVADGGMDKSALAQRKGVVLKQAAHWGEVDTGQTARRALKDLLFTDGALMYDSVGVGAGCKAEFNRLKESDIPGEASLIPAGLIIEGWNAGAAVLYPEENLIRGDKRSPLNKDYFLNLKAQAWWQLSRRFWRTWRAVEEGIEYDTEDLISLDSSSIPRATLQQLIKELSQATSDLSTGRLKWMVNKTPEGTRSPNIADAVVEAYWPVVTSRYTLENL